MQWYEYLFGISSVLGLFVSVLTLITTRRTKAALKEYRKKQDTERLRAELNLYEESLSRCEVNQQKGSTNRIYRELDRYSILYKGSISPELENAIAAAVNSISAENDDAENVNIQKLSNSSMSTLSAFLEKELIR